MSFPWKYRTVSAGMEISGCQTKVTEPDEDGNGEVSSSIQERVFFYIFHVLKECILTFFLKLDQTHEQKFSSILSK